MEEQKQSYQVASQKKKGPAIRGPGRKVNQMLSESLYQTLERVFRFKGLPLKEPRSKNENGAGKTDTHTSKTNAEIAWAESGSSPPAKPNRQHVLKKCHALAKDGRILDRFSEDLHKLGVTGEDRASKLIYLALTTRLFDKPMSLAVKGQSSSGKSFVAENVLKFFPTQARWELTAMSEKALLYSQRPIKNRFLVLYENAGLNNDQVDYLVRSLLSEGKLKYEYTVFDQGKTEFIEREGPTGLLTTTTRISLHPENETRLLSIPINDSAAQTQAVMKALADTVGQGGTPAQSVDLKEWRAFQDWLWLGEHQVVVPFAPDLVKAIPPVAVRLRRDISKVFVLIQAHALLHQENRQRDAKGRIEATVDDYEVVYGLIVDLVAEAVEATVPTEVRETVEAVAALKKSGTFLPSTDSESGVSLGQLGEHMGLDKGTVSRRVNKAVKRGYLVNLEKGKGRPARVVLGDSLPQEVTVLPHPDKLRA